MTTLPPSLRKQRSATTRNPNATPVKPVNGVQVLRLTGSRAARMRQIVEGLR